MRYLSLAEVFELHERLIATSSGIGGIRDIHLLESSVSQPRVTFDKHDLYPDVVSKAAALCHSLIMNHPFVDGNKRVGHAAMETFLILNGFEIDANIDEQERIVLDVASGKMRREERLSRLKDMNAQGCCLVGHPDYYIKFGFKNMLGFVHDGVPQEVFFALSFDGHTPQGTVTFHDGFKADG